MPFHPDVSKTAKVVESFGERAVQVTGNIFTPDEARAAGELLYSLANEAERNPELETLIADMEDIDEVIGFDSAFSFAKALIKKGYRKVNTDD